MGSATNPHDDVADLYDRARPGYPAALFDAIVDYADLSQSSRILEIGCGTGQATLPMARRGYAIDAIEKGARMAGIARRNLADFPGVRVIPGDYESCDLPAGLYDLALSATAFHWIDRRIRYRKTHALLKTRGALALCWHRPTQTQRSRDSLPALQEVYARVVPHLAAGYQPPPAPADVKTDFGDELRQSGFFTDVRIFKRLVAIEYDAASYSDLLNTFSDNRALDDTTRQRLVAEIAALIDGEFGGTLLRETVALLYLARRK